MHINIFIRPALYTKSTKFLSPNEASSFSQFSSIHLHNPNKSLNTTWMHKCLNISSQLIFANEGKNCAFLHENTIKDNSAEILLNYPFKVEWSRLYTLGISFLLLSAVDPEILPRSLRLWKTLVRCLKAVSTHTQLILDRAIKENWRGESRVTC